MESDWVGILFLLLIILLLMPFIISIWWWTIKTIREDLVDYRVYKRREKEKKKYFD